MKIAKHNKCRYLSQNKIVKYASGQVSQIKIVIFLPLDGPPINITAFNMIEF